MFFCYVNFVFPPLGAVPELWPKYKESINFEDKTFTCFDNSKVINLSAFNDDFADCDDGSDEPGTSASTSGLFYCKNDGYFPEVIKKWSVGDGICDCVDGSDELYNSNARCNNKTFELMQQLQPKLQSISEIYNESQKVLSELQQKIRERSLLDLFNDQTTQQNARMPTFNFQFEKFSDAIYKKFKGFISQKIISQRSSVDSMIKSAFNPDEFYLYRGYSVKPGQLIKRYGREIGYYTHTIQNTQYFENKDTSCPNKAKLHLYCYKSTKIVESSESQCDSVIHMLSPIACGENSTSSLKELTPSEVTRLSKWITN